MTPEETAKARKDVFDLLDRLRRHGVVVNISAGRRAPYSITFFETSDKDETPEPEKMDSDERKTSIAHYDYISDTNILECFCKKGHIPTAWTVGRLTNILQKLPMDLSVRDRYGESPVAIVVFNAQEPYLEPFVEICPTEEVES